MFAYSLGWFPTSGGYSESTPGWNLAFVYDAVSHAFLPAVALMIVTPIGWILGMRNTMIMNLGEDYIRLAKAKGLPDRTVALRYAARNALLPSVTGFALALGGLLGGAILVETAFDYPGLGRLMGEAVANKDYPLLQTLMLLTHDGRADRQPHRRPALRSSRSARQEGRTMTTPGFSPAGAPDQAKNIEVDPEGSAKEASTERPESWYAVIWSSKKARVGVITVGIFILIAIFAPLIAPHDPTDVLVRPADAARAGPTGSAPPPTVRTSPPSSSSAPGSRCSWACSAGLFATVIALVVGMISGYAEGTSLDDVLSFVTNVALVIPVLPLIITLVAYSPMRGVGADHLSSSRSRPGPVPPGPSGRRSSRCATATSSPRRSSPVKARCGSSSARSCRT